ncbi:MAG: ABC transporter ATP-binding protein [Candidatus Binatia bacterium]
MTSTSALEVRNISFGYNGGLLLNNLSFVIAAGELIALIGPNGSGKTTLLKILLGLLAPNSGTVTLHGQALSTYQPKARAKTIAYVSQQPALSFPLTARELVSLGRYPHGARGKESVADKLAVANALERTAATELCDRQFNTLSGGEKQKVLIARALAQSARVLILDEPTLHLDLKFQLQILSALKRLCVDERITVITVLHDVNLASLFADQALLLSGGALRGFGPVTEVINEASIKALLDVDMTAIAGTDSRPRYFVPRDPYSK